MSSVLIAKFFIFSVVITAFARSSFLTPPFNILLVVMASAKISPVSTVGIATT